MLNFIPDAKQKFPRENLLRCKNTIDTRARAPFSAQVKKYSNYMDFSARLAGLEILARFEITGLGFLARAELRRGLNRSPCNRQFDFKRICFRNWAEISAQDEIRHLIRPLDMVACVPSDRIDEKRIYSQPIRFQAWLPSKNSHEIF